MNRNFMQFMRENYNELTTDHFQRTVVDEQEGDDQDEEWRVRYARVMPSRGGAAMGGGVVRYAPVSVTCS